MIPILPLKSGLGKVSGILLSGGKWCSSIIRRSEEERGDVSVRIAREHCPSISPEGGLYGM